MMMVYLQVLLLIIAANGAPIIGRLLLEGQWSAPLDGGATFMDGRPVLGKSKTYRGVAFSLVGTVLAADVLGMPWEIGLLVGGLAMTGDCLSSFIKRRLGYDSGGMALGLDQIPESLLPLLGVWGVLSLSAIGIMATVGAFMVFELIFSPILYKFHIRQHPH
ncbi:MAG: CDP-archaeol synthase [Nitrospirota bacterium]|nr:CDP-archaeol synthase [Nitrospirota bacterium]